MSFDRIGLAAATAAVVWFVAACDDSTGLIASFPNEIDTVTLYALQATPITAPSAFDIVNARASRTDRGELFDFALDFDESDTPLLFPAGALNIDPPQAGLQIVDESFADVDRALDEDYVLISPVAVATGDVLIARSRNTSELCGFYGALPRYGKFHVIGIDRVERSVTLEYLVNQNCGFRSLEPGFPTF